MIKLIFIYRLICSGKIKGGKMKKNILLLVLILFVFSISSVFSQDITIKEGTYNTQSGNKLEVYCPGGDVKLNSSGAEQVILKITGNQKAQDNLDILVNELSTGINISVTLKNRNESSNINLSIEVTVPMKYNAEIKTAGGDVECNNIEGNISIKTAGGDILLANCTGSFDVATAGGDISAKRIKGELEAKTAGGNLNLDAEVCKITAKTAAGTIDLSYLGENKGIDMKTNSGDIRVYLPDNINADCTFSTIGGGTSCEFDLRDITTNTSKLLVGRINAGGLNIYLSTNFGSIQVRKP